MIFKRLGSGKLVAVTSDGLVLATDAQGMPVAPQVGDVLETEPSRVLDVFLGG